jgi:hypothetical protein
MADMAKLTAVLNAEYKGRAAFANAQKDATGFGHTMDNLGKKIAGVFAGYKIAQFAKSSVNAFLQEDKAIASLNQQLRNLGMASATLTAPDFLQSIQNQTGVVKDVTIPAYQTLIRATQDVKKTQDLLKLSLDISAGTGKDVGEVSNALSKAYLGNNTALLKLNVGLTKADMSTKSFTQQTDKLQSLFAGQAAAAADTYLGKLNRIKSAFGEIQQGVGQGLVDGFTQLAGSNGSIDGAINKMLLFGQESSLVISGLIANIGKLTGAINTASLGIPGWLVKMFGRGLVTLSGNNYQTLEVDAIRAKQREAQKLRDQEFATLKSQEAIRKQNAANALADQKKLNAQNAIALKQKQDQAVLDKASALLKQSQATFDLQKIALYAAAQNETLTADEKLRLSMMQTQDQLAAAIENKNLPLVEQLTNKLQAQTNQFALMHNIDPYTAFTLGADALTQSLIAAANAQKYLNDEMSKMGQGIGGGLNSGGTGGTNTPVAPSLVAAASFANEGMAGAINESRVGSGVQQIVVAIDGAAIAQATVGQSAAGVTPTYQKNAFQGNLYW